MPDRSEPPARRILVTGAAGAWGARLVALLLADPAIERVVALDSRPARDGGPDDRLAWLQLDVRSRGLRHALLAERVDGVVHLDVLQMPEPGRSARALHDLNVVGTLQLLAACAGLPALRTIVVRSSASVYGSEPGAPSFLREEAAAPPGRRTRFQRDVGELEDLVAGFARRHPRVACCVLRMQPVIGAWADTPVGRLMRPPVVPTVLGFDPRIQLLDADDAIAALRHALAGPVRGAVNIAPADATSLARGLRRAGRTPLPLAPPLWEPLTAAARRAARLPPLPAEIGRWLRFGRVVDVTRQRELLGFAPRRGTLDALAAAVAGARAPA